MKPILRKKIRQQLTQSKLDALVVTNYANVSYLSGFSSEGQLLLMPDKEILITDFRFVEQVNKMKNSLCLFERKNLMSLEKALAHLVKRHKIKRMGFEAASLSYKLYRGLKRSLSSCALFPTCGIVEQIRAVKSAEEVKILKQAATLAVRSYNFACKIIKPGLKEVDIARELEYFMKKKGAEEPAFKTIIASGKRSSMPHAFASDKVIKDKEIVLIDLGCNISGYNSDLTRMFFLSTIKGKIKKIEAIVSQAQRLAINAIRAGVKICEIDKIARQFIARKGLGPFFGHALGHGIGREVHEYPSITSNNQDTLKEGMVLTVEPAVYIPGWGGLRIEDMVLVTKSGCRILTRL